MNRQRSRPRLIISHGPKKKEEYDNTPPPLGSLSPDLQPCSPLSFYPIQDESNSSSNNSSGQYEEFLKIGRYVVHQTTRCGTCTAVDESTGDEYLCKVLPLSKYKSAIAAYLATDGHPNVVGIWEIVKTDSHAYVFFQRGYGDLHSYVRERKKLRQEEARGLARQVIDAVRHCHQSGVVLRDLKLRKFVFTNQDRTQLRLDGLDDAIVLENEDASDTLTDKHGCPAYVSPEILSARNGYSGKCADLWSLGVMVFTMLVGRYPFHDKEPLALFGKIRRGVYKIPDTVPARAKCLVRNLLRQDPNERLSAEEALEHPWFTRPLMIEPVQRPVPLPKGVDQRVPNYDFDGNNGGMLDNTAFEFQLPN